MSEVRILCYNHANSTVGTPYKKKRFMMEVNLVEEGFKFMILGMGIVFVFLSIMIAVMNIMSKIIHKFFPEPDPAQPPIVVGATGDKKKVVAAIFAAIMEDKKSQA